MVDPSGPSMYQGWLIQVDKELQGVEDRRKRRLSSEGNPTPHIFRVPIQIREVSKESFDSKFPLGLYDFETRTESVIDTYRKEFADLFMQITGQKWKDICSEVVGNLPEQVEYWVKLYDGLKLDSVTPGRASYPPVGHPLGNPEDLVVNGKGKEKLECYGESSSNLEASRIDLIKNWLTLDAIFIVCFIQADHQRVCKACKEHFTVLNKALEKKTLKSMLHVIRLDIFKFENQLPLGLIRNVVTMMSTRRNQNLNADDAHSEGKDPFMKFVVDAVSLIYCDLPGPSNGPNKRKEFEDSLLDVKIDTHRHLLQCLYSVVCFNPKREKAASNSENHRDGNPGNTDSPERARPVAGSESTQSVISEEGASIELSGISRENNLVSRSLSGPSTPPTKDLPPSSTSTLEIQPVEVNACSAESGAGVAPAMGRDRWQVPPAQAPLEQTTPARAPPEQAPPAQTPPEQGPRAQAPPMQASSAETPPAQASAAEALPAQVPAGEAPAAQASAAESPAAEAPPPQAHPAHKDSKGSHHHRPHKLHLPTVTQLKEAGIRVSVGQGNWISDVMFESSCFKGNLYLPAIGVYDETESLLRNLLTYEYVVEDQKDLLSFVYLMDNLIDTDQDVKMMMDTGVLKNKSLGSDENLANMWNTLLVGVVLSLSKLYQNVFDEISPLSHSKLRKTGEAFRTIYLRHPWALFGGILVGFGFLATVFATVFTALTYYYGNPQRHSNR